MQVVSGRPGRQQIHFEGPPADRVPAEMARFLAWFEDRTEKTDPVLKAAIAHIWFETIHPFDDGNGRIGRAIADLELARSEGTGQRFYSMPARLQVERPAYYATLEATQKGNLDITQRLAWFLGVLDQALCDAEAMLAATIRKSRFWKSLAGRSINERQHVMLNRLLDGFVGETHVLEVGEDRQMLAGHGLARHRCGVLVKEAASGRSTSYVLAA